MNVIGYIEKYGNLTFEEKGLNGVDKLIFANLSYVDFADIVSKNAKNKKTIEEVARIFFARKYNKKKNIMAVRGGIKLLKAMAASKRYQNLLLYNFERLVNDDQQFAAITIQINDNLVYVSFEGTDQMMIGWEEDFIMSYKFPVKSQKSASNYLNRHFFFKKEKIILGGHSKGGNLAIVGGMYCNFFVRRKIKEIYSYDGPGLLRKQINSKKYKKIEEKTIHVIPNNSIVGLMLYSSNNRVVKTNHIGMLSHFALNWKVNDFDLIDDSLKTSSNELNKKMDEWVEKYSKEQKQRFVRELFDVFRKNEINSLIDIMNKPTLLIRILSDATKMDKQTSIMFKEFTSMVRVYFFKSVKETIIK